MSKINRLMKLVLGTVQFGLQYGVNSAGRPNEDSIQDILSLALNSGITTLDTSAAYGNSEEILGKIIEPNTQDFNIISKYPKGDNSINQQLQITLGKLNCSSLYGYLLHHFDVYRENSEVWQEMLEVKRLEKVQKIGFSLYSPNELELIWERGDKFDLVQFPYNIFDRQFEPYMQRLKDEGVEIHVRSTFLQGLFFRDLDNLPEKLEPLKPYLEKLRNYARENDMTIEQVAMNFNIQNPLIDGVLIGVDNAEQLEQNICSIVEKGVSLYIDVKETELLNPSNWK